ncbi:hypothetical protein BDP55DRAFT_683325 [Colletotrichum godetiae]|uniref:Uncharacterized protein n=1 Tax=Colletotrichum godetiae TaxID=1209918 RepID=A0AAJ0EN52_9PEZI|nr:uncharacterized protein BDP55DRAFT_683325 [Colletotrichum godetiae]KAK1658201.1 hypothetical protein BDP55DRAFT_683325 [Colletotrichum godetiae]
MTALACQDYDCGETRLFYLTPDNIIRDIKDGGEEGRDGWSSGGLVWAAGLSASPKSQLAVTLRQIANSTGPTKVSRIIAYQAKGGRIFVANDIDHYTTSKGLDGILEATTNADLAMVTQFSGKVLDQVTLVASGPGNSSMIEAKYDGETDVWSKTEPVILDSIPQSDDSSSIATQQFAVTMRNNYLDSVYLALSSDGTISGRIMGQKNELLSNITLETSEGELAKFSAIATTLNGYLYGIVNNTIREYLFDTSDASILHLNRIVYNTTDCT